MARLKGVMVALAALAITAGLLWAAIPASKFTDVEITDDLDVADDATVGDDFITDTIYASETGKFAGAVTCSSTINAQGAATFDSTCVVSGTFDARTAAQFAKAVTCSSTLDVTGNATFAIAIFDTIKPTNSKSTKVYARAYDGQNDLTFYVYEVSATTLVGDLQGDAAQSVTYQGNLPTASEHTGEFYRNTAGDTLWYADNNSWVQIAP